LHGLRPKCPTDVGEAGVSVKPGLLLGGSRTAQQALVRNTLRLRNAASEQGSLVITPTQLTPPVQRNGTYNINLPRGNKVVLNGLIGMARVMMLLIITLIVMTLSIMTMTVMTLSTITLIISTSVVNIFVVIALVITALMVIALVITALIISSLIIGVTVIVRTLFCQITHLAHLTGEQISKKYMQTRTIVKFIGLNGSLEDTAILT